ncbi:MAG TPA: response regulator [Patescibacteria group bacterium]|nr:response regulator [Patescibacteria group bacterium]
MNFQNNKKHRAAILVVEDDPVTAHLMKRVLQERYFVHHATYGHEALKLIYKYQFDLALMDIDLDDVRGEEYLDGFDVIERIRGDKNFSSMIIIAITNNPRESLFKDFIEAGFNDYVKKPVSPQQIMELVEKALALKQE